MKKITGTRLVLLIFLVFSFMFSIPQKIENDNCSIENNPRLGYYFFYSYAYEWDVTWSYPGIEFCNDMVLDSSDNVYLVGKTSDHYDPYRELIVKFDKNGTPIWNYIGDLGEFDGVDLDSNGNVYVINSYELKKFNSIGTLNWSKTFPTELKTLYITKENDILLAGGAGSYFLMKCNISGDIEWNCTWNGAVGAQIQVDELKNVYVVGTTSKYGAGGSDACLVKINASGEFEWFRTFGGPDADRGNSLCLAHNRTIFIAGSIQIKGSDSDMFAAKFDENGTKLYHKILGNYNRYDTCRSILINEEYNGDGDDFYLCGEYYFTGDDRNMAIYSVRGSESGTQAIFHIWDGKDEYHPITSEYDSANNIIIAGWLRNTTTGNYDMCYARFGKDSDFDALSDYQEDTLFHTNKQQSDSDYDGLTDYEEVKIYHTNPNAQDTDGDGQNDEVEVLNGFDPNNPFSNGYIGIFIITFSVFGALLGIPILINVFRKILIKRKHNA